MLHLDGVAHGVDVGDGGLHPVVDHDRPFDPQLQPRVPGESGVRGDADGQHHHVGVEGGLVLEQHVHAALPLPEALHRAAQGQPDLVASHLAVEEGRHVRVEGVHQLPGPLDDGDLQPQLPQVLRQLQSDEAAPRQHGGPGPLPPDVLFDPEGVLHRAQGEHPAQPHPGQLGLGGPGPRGEDQLVVGLFERLPGGQVLHRHRFPLRVEGGDLVEDPHIHPEPGVKAFRRLKG